MRVMKFTTVAVVLAMLFTIAIAQQADPAQNAPAVKHIPIKNAPPDEGKDMYDRKPEAWLSRSRLRQLPGTVSCSRSLSYWPLAGWPVTSVP